MTDFLKKLDEEDAAALVETGPKYNVLTADEILARFNFEYDLVQQLYFYFLNIYLFQLATD